MSAFVAAQSLTEYSMTIGLLIAFITLLVSIALGKKQMLSVFSQCKLRKWHIALVVIIVLVFACAELYLVQPTQQLFFDDAIYQAMAQQLLHTGQAWMCDFGTPNTCYIGEIFHEPIGTSFNLAIGFALLGVNQDAAFDTGFALSAIAVFISFFVALLLLNDIRAAFFSEFMFGITPVVLVWARATSSDMPMLTYSLIAIFAMLVFIRKKSVYTFAMLASSLVVVSYMKVEALVFLPIIAVMYLVLDDRSITRSLKRNMTLAKKALSSNACLIIFTVLTISLIPEIFYVYAQYTTASYGAQGTTVQNTCGSGSITATGNFGLNYFEYNICANSLFWLDQFQTQYIMQPPLFTVLAVLGAVLMVFEKRRELAALGIWFLAFFLLYTAFYAGGVTYGVDWRYMLSLVAQASIFAGFGCSGIIQVANGSFEKLMRSRRYRKGPGAQMIVAMVAATILVLLILYSIYLMVPQLTVQPSNIMQAGDARFYENFVYNDSHLIPSDCIVFTYDPTLFNINNRSALQMSYIYNAKELSNVTSAYSCLVVDYGYWCYTPDNLCQNLNSVVSLKPIANATYAPMGKQFSFYYATVK